MTLERPVEGCSDGSTLGEHLEQVARSKKLDPQEFLERYLRTPCPEQARYLFDYFLQLHIARGSNGWGFNPLSFTEIASWSTLTGIELGPWELETIKHIDIAYLKIINGRPRGN